MSIHIKKTIFLLLLLLLWSAGYYFNIKASDVTGHISGTVLDEKGFSISELNRYDDVRAAFSAYKVKEGTTLHEPLMGRSTVSNVLLIWGNKEIIYNIPIRHGSYGTGIKGECTISLSIARKLFGSDNPVGLFLEGEGKSWIIRGVMDTLEPVVFFTADETYEMDRFEFKFYEKCEYEETAKALLYESQLDKKVELMDYSLFTAVTRVFSMLPFIILLWILRSKIAGKITKKRAHYFIWIVFWSLLIFVISRMFRFPSYFLPSKWSDFDFWTARLRDIAAALKKLFRSEPLYKPLLARRQTGLSILCSVSASLGFIFLNIFSGLSKRDDI